LIFILHSIKGNLTYWNYSIINIYNLLIISLQVQNGFADKITSNRRNQVNQLIYQIIYKTIKNKYEKNKDLDEECSYFVDDAELWEYYSWVLTKTGVTITASYPHAMTPCAVGFPLTYEELKQGK